MKSRIRACFRGLCILMIIVIIPPSWAQKDEYLGPQEKRILDTILDIKYYDKHFRPAKINGSEVTAVSNRIQIHRIVQLEDISRVLQIDFTLHQDWLDERLKFSHLNSEIQDLNAPYSAVESIWVPDTYIKEVVSNPLHSQSISSFRTAKVLPDGRVMYSRREFTNILCPWTWLENYPHENIKCSMSLSSYAYTEKDLILQWPTSEVGISFDTENNDAPPYVFFDRSFQPYCSSIDLEPLTNKTCIQADIYFKRSFTSTVMLIYTPTIMLIVMSYLSFFIHPVKMSTTRALIALVPLTLGVILTFLLNTTLPRTSTVKAIDIWTGTALLFLMLSLLQFVIVCCLCKLSFSGREEIKEDIYEELPTVLKKFNVKPKKRCPEAEKELIYTKCAVWTDYATRILYPVLYFSFCFVYFVAAVSIPLN